MEFDVEVFDARHLANILAAVLTFRFIVRFKRPIKHLIRNRTYTIRSDCSSPTEVTRVIGRLWHIPALLLVGASLVAIFVTGGDVVMTQRGRMHGIAARCVGRAEVVPYLRAAPHTVDHHHRVLRAHALFFISTRGGGT